MQSSIVFDEHEKQRRLLQSEPWYHHSLSRKVAESLVRVGGDFLIRESSRNPGVFVLTGKWNGRPFHLSVNRSEEVIHSTLVRFTYFFEEHKKGSVIELVRFHWTNQVPMTRKSEAIICRPVYCTRGSFEVALFHPLPLSKSRHRGILARVSRTNSPGLSASMNDLTGQTSFVENLIDRTGTSVQDLSNGTYVDPNLLLTNLTQLGQEVSDNELSFNRLSLNSAGSQVLPPTLVVPLDADNPKLSSLNRKQIRYVQMHESPSIASMLTDKFDINRCFECGMESGGCYHKHCCGSATGGLTHDLTLPLADKLVSHVGPVHRALSPGVWKRLSLSFSTRSFVPFNYARHLTAISLRLLTLLNCSRMAEATAVSTPFLSSSAQIREHILVRDRYYHLFIIATVLFTETLEARTLVVIFWLDVAQCLRSILRDHHTLNFVRSAILSPQLTSLSRLWDNVLRNCNMASVAMLREWREKQSEHDTFRRAHDVSVTLSSDSEKCIPNLIPLLHHLSDLDDTSGSLNASGDQLAILASLPNGSSMCELTTDNNTGRESIIACLSQTETVLTLLLGPIKLENSSELKTLAVKIERVLTEIAAVLTTSQ
ncbi:unnamed protein product [Dicrocoelium dendriticum]|nr:unnamed protein product [Dicrocoelium dendriticum]